MTVPATEFAKCYARFMKTANDGRLRALTICHHLTGPKTPVEKFDHVGSIGERRSSLGDEGLARGGPRGEALAW